MGGGQEGPIRDIGILHNHVILVRPDDVDAMGLDVKCIGFVRFQQNDLIQLAHGLARNSDHVLEYVAKDAGLTAKGREKYKRETGSNLKAPAPNPKTKADAGRKASFCARVEGVVKNAKGPAERAKAE